MPEKIYPFWEQNENKNKPMIEDVMPHYLTGDNLKIALEFMAYLRENKIKPTWSLLNGWKGVCKGKVLYWIRLPQVKSNTDAEEPTHCHFRNIKQSNKINWTNSWVITPYFNHIAMYENTIISDGLDNFFLENIHPCRPNCGSEMKNPRKKSCMPGINKTLFGKEAHGICRSDLYNTMTAWFVNPNETEARQIKRLLELETQARKNTQN